MVNAGDHEEPKDPKFRPEGVNGGSRAGERCFLSDLPVLQCIRGRSVPVATTAMIRWYLFVDILLTHSTISVTNLVLELVRWALWFCGKTWTIRR